MSEVGESAQMPRTGPGTPGLERLQQRLDALQSSVERLGTEQWAPSAPPAPAAPPLAGYPPPPPYAPAPGYPGSGPADPYGTVPAYSPAPLQYEPAATAPPLPGAYPPEPVSPNGQTEPAAPDVPVTVITVGPFPDLIALRHFEEALDAQEAVNEVHVRRFGLGWAEVEVGLLGDYPIAGELQRLGRPMKLEADANGQLVVQFTDLTPEAEAEAEAPIPEMEPPLADQGTEG